MAFATIRLIKELKAERFFLFICSFFMIHWKAIKSNQISFLSANIGFSVKSEELRILW